MISKDIVKIDIDLNEFSDDIASLIPDLISSKTTRRSNARIKLEQIGPKVLDQLSNLIKTKNKQLKWEIAKSLESGSTRGSIPILLKLLADEESDIRWLAAEGLINIGRDSIIPLLHQIIYDESIYLCEGAHHVLQELLVRNERKKFHNLLQVLKHNKIVRGMASVKAMEMLENYNKSDFT